jgi:hypothetical protein
MLPLTPVLTKLLQSIPFCPFPFQFLLKRQNTNFKLTVRTAHTEGENMKALVMYRKIIIRHFFMHTIFGLKSLPPARSSPTNKYLF